MSVWAWIKEALGFTARRLARDAAERALDQIQKRANAPMPPATPLDVGERVKAINRGRRADDTPKSGGSH